MSYHILIVDDEPAAVENLTHICEKEGYVVQSTTSGQAALELIEKHHFDLVLTDLRIDEVDGMEILHHTQSIDRSTEVILISGYASFDSAVSAMSAGAFHYLAKPFRLNEVREVIRKALDITELKRENRSLKQEISEARAAPSIITRSPIMEKLLSTARKVASTNSTLLITGESGTGKELLARYLHQHSNRSEKRFQAINCGALQEELLASELFGHEKGAFTGATESHTGLFEAADGGTLFLDEIAEMSPSMQVKLLRVIQEGEIRKVGSTLTIKVDVRLITATHRNLIDEISKGSFRQDLYYRLNVIHLELPSLSQREDDIPLLANHFLQKHGNRMGLSSLSLSQEALSALLQHSFPGNIRELENIIEHSIAFAQGGEITLTDLPHSLNKDFTPSSSLPARGLQTLAEHEKEYIKHILEQCDGNKTKAASILGIDRVSLWRKMKSFEVAE